MESQDLAHQNNEKFINRFNEPVNDLIASIEFFLNILNPENGDLNTQGNLIGQPRIGGIDDQQYRILINAKTAKNRTDCTIQSLENLIAIIIPYDFNIEFHGDKTISIIIPDDVELSDQERANLLNLLPHPIGIKWLLKEQAFFTNYGKDAKYNNGKRYFNPQILD